VSDPKPNWNQYRQRIYDKYVSEMVRPDGSSLAQQDYQRWADAAAYRLHDWLPADTTVPVLDLGCGAGQFLYLLRQRGYDNLTGVDRSPEQVALARTWCPQATILQGDVREALSEARGRYGLITGFDIIEHFRKEEQLQFLEAVVGALRPGGRLILQTPNAESPWFGAPAYSDYTHEWFFTPRGLGYLLRHCGLQGYLARQVGPYPHGWRSRVRLRLWKVLAAFWRLYNLVETGSPGSGIYTRVFIASAVKPQTGLAHGL
jgi:2-polyprenyl-3-methyl-5-hydroxy-6-metoxy-1,4-benzoquinol methylase